jgi:large subunit ribosomal protein LP0
VNEVHLVHKAAKVGASEATLLNMLNISPFTYGMVVQQVYDSGNVFAPSILDIEESTLLTHFTAAIRNVASVSLAVGYPTIVSVSHSLVNSYKNLLAISVETDYDFEGSEKVIIPISVLFVSSVDESKLRSFRPKGMAKSKSL